MLNPTVRITSTRVAVILLALGFFVVLFAYGAYESASLTAVDVVKYAILCLLCALVPLVADRKAIAVAVVLIAIWGLSLAAIKLSFGIAMARDKGQTYLTLGYALGCSSLFGLLIAAGCPVVPGAGGRPAVLPRSRRRRRHAARARPRPVFPFSSS